MTNKHNRHGASGALLDEYERAIGELIETIRNISNSELTMTSDHETIDINCTSIQTILSHVVSCGYSYAKYISSLKGVHLLIPNKYFHLTVTNYIQDLKAVFAFTIHVFKDVKDNELEQFDNSLKIHTTWNQIYDIEQIMEHAIVHVLRHRRQIENRLAILKGLNQTTN